MSTDKPTNELKPQPTESVISFIPLGERDPIQLTVARVKAYLCTPTRSGVLPTDKDVMGFIMLCKASGLNPWVRDAYLVGYDSKDGPNFSLITSHQAFLKRGEAHEAYDGMASGVIVMSSDVLTYRDGDLVLAGETLVGGWARVHRRDRSYPSYDAINLSTFNTQRSRWAADPAGMVVKVAEASALRKAFPSNLAGLYLQDERDKDIETTRIESAPVERVSQSSRVMAAAQRIAPPAVEAPTEPSKPVEPVSTPEPAKPTPAELFAARIDAATTLDQLSQLGEELGSIESLIGKGTYSALCDQLAGRLNAMGAQ